jgi:hypothetical protein
VREKGGVLTSAGPTRPESRASLSLRTVWISINKKFPSLGRRGEYDRGEVRRWRSLT